MKRLLALFLTIVLLGGFSFAQKREIGKVKTLVIDPGHGGDKPGAIGKKSMEKDIVLSVSLLFGKLVEDNFPDVKVIYTRNTDVDISLANRANMANKNKADLFISIHANSHTTTQPTGVETFVMGLSQSRANMEVAKKENADILLEAGYKNNSEYQGFDPNSPESYVMFAMYQNAYIDKSLDFAQYIQNEYKSSLRTINRGVKQAELFVIYKTAMPSVLTEIGFISNPEEENFMTSKEGQAKIALCLFNAFCNYKANVENTARLENPYIKIPGYTAPAKPVVNKLVVPDSVKAQTRAASPAPKAETPKAEPEKKAEAPMAKEETKPVVKEEPKPVAKPIETEKKVETPKAEPTPEPTVEPKAEPKPEPKAEPKVEPKVEPKPEPKPVVKEEPKPQPKAEAPKVEQPAPKPQTPPSQPAPKTESNANGVVTYKVQFLTSGRILKEGESVLNGITGFSYYEMGGIYRYTMGNETSIENAVAIQNDLREKGFKDAFVIGWYNGQRISLQQAKEIKAGK